jgi:uncharacterized protein YggU (UPF0235/DUF167 family)
MTGPRAKQIRVQVTPGSRREKFKELRPGVFEISVREEAEGNKANMRVRELVAEHFNITVRQVQIESGHRSSKKRLCIL